MNRVENISANGEITHHEQFVILPQCFQKLFAAEVCGKGLIMLELVTSKEKQAL